LICSNKRNTITKRGKTNKYVKKGTPKTLVIKTSWMLGLIGPPMPSNIRPKAPTSIAPMLALIFFTIIKRIFHKKSKCEKKNKKTKKQKIKNTK